MAHDLAWFPVYATETLADERFQGWTCEERGAWFSLALLCWHEGSIPASHDQLRRVLHLDAPTFSVVWQAVGDRFAASDEKPDRLTSPRMEKERVRARRIIAERAKAGAKGGKAKAERARKPPSNCQANAKQTSSVALANPTPSHTQLPTTTPIPTARARLVSPYGDADPCPATTAVLAALWERGIDGAPPSDKQAERVEAAIKAAGIPAAVERLAAVLPGSDKKPLTFHVDAIRSGAKPRRNVGDLGCDLVPWHSRLTPEERQQAQAELNALGSLDPDLAGAPLGIAGNPASPAWEAFSDLNAKWRAIAEERS